VKAKQIENLGLLREDVISPLEWSVGGLTPLTEVISNPSGSWLPYLPVVEHQNRYGFDRMACVSYSLLNCLEILIYYQVSEQKNFSDRFLAAASGTTRQGNFLSRVFDTAKEVGFVLESDYPDVSTWDEYYQPIPQSVYGKAVKYEMYREFIFLPNRKERMFQALQETPLQVTVAYANGDSILNPAGDDNHAVCLVNAKEGKYWEIFDHYTQSLKKYHWNYFDSKCAVLKPTIIFKENIMKVKDNSLYLLVEGPSQELAMGLDGKLVIFDEWVQAIVNAESRAKTPLIPIPVTLKDWNSVPHVNAKGQAIS
jgi:hypothetical protein